MPTRVSALALVAAVRRLDHVRTLGVGNISLHDLPEARLGRLARHAQLAWGQTLARMGEERRPATPLVFAQALERTATDDILDLFDGLLTSLALRGETKRRRERLRFLKDLDQAALVLHQAVRMLLDESVPEAHIRTQVLGRIGEIPLRAAADAVQALASRDDDWLHQALRRQEVFVATSERYGDPRAELLQGEAWEAARDSIARALDRSFDPAVELARLQVQLRAAYTEVRENLPHNTALQQPGPTRNHGRYPRLQRGSLWPLRPARLPFQPPAG